MTRATLTFLATMATGVVLAAIAQALALPAAAGVIIGIAYMLAIALIVNSCDQRSRDSEADGLRGSVEGGRVHSHHIAQGGAQHHVR